MFVVIIPVCTVVCNKQSISRVGKNVIKKKPTGGRLRLEPHPSSPSIVIVKVVVLAVWGVVGHVVVMAAREHAAKTPEEN
jgi:hypothetical protein